MKTPTFAVVTIACLVATCSSHATTWFVEKDGSGDYTVIQDAIDAAANGDTIRVGVGRYDEGRIIETSGWTEYVRILIELEELTLIGAGREVTIIGPDEPWTLDRGFDRGIEASNWWGCDRLAVKDVCFENMAFAINADTGLDLVVTNCLYRGNHYSVFVAEGDAAIDSCVFEYMPMDGAFVLSWHQLSLAISDCSMKLEDEHFWTQKAIHIDGTSLVAMARDSIAGGKFGIGMTGAGDISIIDCAVEGQSEVGVFTNGSQKIHITGSEFRNQNIALGQSGIYADWTIRHSDFLAASEAVLRFHDLGSFSMQNCRLEKGPQYVVWEFFCDKLKEPSAATIDMTHNDWGTIDPDSIASWIHCCDYEVEFIPFVDPTPVEIRTQGDLRRIFR